ncbi:hypothetical protein OG417_29070 [Actinoallomurus sp. NBC_01490]|uniref:hypothetical protein n=1 Tax=Actinoallomurus sp. NBC_01490 TaxID=2903557 RepID=UPI002E32FA6C|nr:hypothetical protein [Actinoallomurus sp. NBC_01490]
MPQRCRSEHVESPTDGQLERVVASAAHRFEEAFAAGVAARLGPVACGRLEDLLGKPGLLAELKSDCGRRYAAGRSTSRAQAGGGTRMKIFRETSRTTATSTTRRWPSRSTPRRSSPT